MKRILFVCLILVLNALYAEKIVLKNGRVIFGTIVSKDNGLLTLESRLGKFEVPVDSIISISKEEELPVEKEESNFKEPFHLVENELIRIQLSGGTWNWAGGDIEKFNDWSFDYWNSVGEIEKYLGKEVVKERTPLRLNSSFKWDVRLLRRFGIFQMGLSFSSFASSFENQTSIDSRKYFDSWKLKGQRLGLVLGLAQVQNSQVLSQVEIGGNFIDFNYQNEVEWIDASSFFLSLKTASGYIVNLGNSISLYAEMGYTLATRPKWKNLSLYHIFDENHHVTRVIFAENQGAKPKIKMSGLELSAGIMIKLIKPSRNKLGN